MIIFCIYSIFNIIPYLLHIVDEYNGYLALIFLFSSLFLTIILLICVNLEKLLFLQILVSMIICGINIGILIYFTLHISDFWIDTIMGLPEFKLASIVSIFCSFTLSIFSYYQTKLKKNLDISIEDLKSKLKLFYLRLSPLLAYFPIIAGILYSMTVIPALAYISWYIFYLLPGFGLMESWIFYFNGYSTNFPVYSLFWIELVIFICGFGLFLHGLIHLVKAKIKKNDIVQTGLYNYIRHPQNLGILIFSFPFCLYVPFLGDHGLKVGDIFSWLLFCLLITIYSDIEEIFMLKRYPDKYRLYKSNTGFFLPKIIKKKKEYLNLTIRTYFKRWFYLIGGFILLITLLTLIFENLPRIIFLRYYSNTSWNFAFIMITILSFFGYYSYKKGNDLSK